MFFICGDGVWPAIPAHIRDGPWSTGKLTLLTPSAKMKHKCKRSISHMSQTAKMILNLGVIPKICNS